MPCRSRTLVGGVGHPVRVVIGGGRERHITRRVGRARGIRSPYGVQQRSGIGVPRIITPKWDRVGIVKYPSRRAFIEMQSRKDFQELHHHKEAGMAETIVAGCLPMELPPLPADAPSWADVPHPPTAADPYVVVVHVIKFKDDDRRDEMATYTDHAAKIAVPHGVRLAAWTQVEGTIMGDGREWDQIRFNVFPSRAAFMAVVMDPERLAAQAAHRETAIADTYTLITRPSIDRLYESITGEPNPYPSHP